jgi:hypothetical protein
MRKKALIVYYSFTQQTRIQVKLFVEGLEEQGVDCVLERLTPTHPYELPFTSTWTLSVAMIQTFLRKKMEILPISTNCFESYDCVIIAGPTWSYHPSGPVLYFIDKYGKKVCGGKLVVPLISCRSYWRIHFWSIKRKLGNCDARVAQPIVYAHPIKEPWRLVGLLMQLRGKMVRKKNSWFRKHYPGYGHSKKQGEEAKLAGITLGKKLHEL